MRINVSNAHVAKYLVNSIPCKNCNVNLKDK